VLLAEKAGSCYLDQPTVDDGVVPSGHGCDRGFARAVKLADLTAANGISSLLLCLTVALAPLPFGSTDAWATSLWCITLGLALTQMQPVQLRFTQWLLLGLAALLIAAYGIVVHEQLVAQPWLPTSQPNPLWQESAALLKTPLGPAVTVMHNQPWLALGPTLAVVLALICAFFVGLDRNRASMLIKAVAWSAAFYALLGVVQFIVDPNMVLWREKQAYANSLTATFINRNTAAVYFGTGSLLWLLLIFQRIEKSLLDGEGARNIWRRMLAQPNRVLVPLMMFILCFGAMLLTSSRAGVVISLAAMVAAPALFFVRRLSKASAVVVALAVGTGLALVVLETIGAGVSSRFDLDQLATGGRWEAYRSTLEMIGDYPWLGTGLGTFAWIFPEYRSGMISNRGVWDRAHNSALELASEMGIPLAVLVVIAWAVVIAVLFYGVRNRRRDRIFPIAGCLVALLALLHSMIDFSMQIPGFAITVAALAGSGLAQSFRTAKYKTRRIGGGQRAVASPSP